MPSWPSGTGRTWRRTAVSPGCPVQRRTTRARTWQPPPQASPWKQSRTFWKHRYLLRWDEMDWRLKMWSTAFSKQRGTNGDGLAQNWVTPLQMTWGVCFILQGAADGWGLHYLHISDSIRYKVSHTITEMKRTEAASIRTEFTSRQLIPGTNSQWEMFALCNLNFNCAYLCSFGRCFCPKRQSMPQQLKEKLSRCNAMLLLSVNVQNMRCVKQKYLVTLCF